MEFNGKEFAKEFAYRTRLNYYSAIKLNTSDEKMLSSIIEKEKSLKMQMQQEGFYADDNIYEVTMLINSIIGLLIFPFQESFKNIPNKEYISIKNFPVLSAYINDKVDGENRFSNTYRHLDNKISNITDLRYERNDAKTIINHLRNAVAHKRIMIYPISEQTCVEKNKKHVANNYYDNKKEITDVIFKDVINYKYENEQWLKIMPSDSDEDNFDAEFYLKIKIEDLEELLTEIYDFIIKWSKSK